MTSTLTTIFAVLSLLSIAATVGVAVLAVAGRGSRSSPAGRLLDRLADRALWLGLLVAGVTMLGSLYYSRLAHFTSGDLCWFQRICEYPLAVAFLIAAIRRDRGIWIYAVVPTLVGMVFAAVHTYRQAVHDRMAPCRPGGKCNFQAVTDVCTYRYVWKFGFVSLPFMDLAALAFILAMVLLLRSGRGSATAPSGDGA